MSQNRNRKIDQAKVSNVPTFKILYLVTNVKVAESRIIYSACTTVAIRKRPVLVVSVSNYGTRGQGSIPWWASNF